MVTANITSSTSQQIVGLAEFAVSNQTDSTLCSQPLGACLGVVIYDPIAKIAGLLHPLLPASSVDPKRAMASPGMFLDSGIDVMLTRIEELGAHRENLLVYAAGGAQIMDESSFFNIGKRNYEVLIGVLEKAGLKICAEDVGGRANRSMQIQVGSGIVNLKISGQAQLKQLCRP